MISKLRVAHGNKNIVIKNLQKRGERAERWNMPASLRAKCRGEFKKVDNHIRKQIFTLQL